jgi:hypothetical protein
MSGNSTVADPTEKSRAHFFDSSSHQLGDLTLNLTPRPSWDRQLKTGPVSLFTCTDAGKDPDDENATLLAAGLKRLGADLYLTGVVANLAPSDRRAGILNGQMAQIGMEHVPVAKGSDCTRPDTSKPYEFDCSYLNLTGINRGEAQFANAFGAARDGTLSLMLLSGMTDAASFFFRYPLLAKDKLREIVIMGGAESVDGRPAIDEHGFIIPDDKAANHAFDIPSSRSVFRFAQEKGIPLVVLSRYAALAAPVPRQLYDHMADTKHEVGVRLHKMQKEAITGLWRRTHLPMTDPERELPERCDPQWFRKQFLGGAGDGLGKNDEIWPLVQHFMLYDPLTMIAAIPELRERFFNPTAVQVNGTTHQIIGVDAVNHGVRDPKELVKFLSESLLEALRT